MNNHCVVPDFEMNDYYPNIPSTIFTTSKKSAIADEEIMELIWQKGQVIVQNQSQNQRCMKKSYLFSEQSAVEESVTASAPLFIHEDEMNSWLQSPLDAADGDSFAADFLYTPPCSAAAQPEKIHTSTAEQPSVETIASAPIVPQLRCTEDELTHRLTNFRYTMPNCAAVTSAVAPPEEIYTSTAEQPSVETIASSSSPRLIMPQLRCSEGESTHRLQNFRYTMPNCTAVTSTVAPVGEILTSTVEIRPPPTLTQLIIPELSSGHLVKAWTVVESNETPIAAMPEYMISCISDNVTSVSAAAATAVVSGGREVTTACELTMTSSTTSGSGGSESASAEQSRKDAHAAAPAPAPEEEDRKRKSRESEDNKGQSEDVEFESADAKKQVRSSTSAKKSRAAEVHNLSERKRRDRINEKMRALQELIPRCNKSDKASMLDEAIGYLKSLQLQVQMMSTGCNMVPMMYPGILQYMPTMGMNMGMGMSMEMGMNGRMVPYPPYPLLMPGTTMRNAAATAQMAPRYPLPAYHLPPFPAPEPSRIPAANQTGPPRLNSLVGHNANRPRLPNFSDPYHQYFGLQQAQLMFPQNQGVEQPSSSKRNTCIEGSTGNRQSG